MLWRVLLMTFSFLGHSLGLQRVLTVTDFMLFDSGDLLYFEVLQPKNISYIYKVRLAKDFGGEFDFSSETVNLVAVDPPQACYSANNGHALRKSVALVQRGGCSFVTKSKLVESYGAIAVFIADNELNNGEVLVDMIQDGTGRDVHIPAAFMFGSDGYHIKRGIKEAGMDGAVISLPLNLTGRPHLYMRQPPWSYW